MQHSLWHLFTNIRNGYLIEKKTIEHPYSRLCLRFLKTLYEEGYINGFSLSCPSKIVIYLKYCNGKPALTKIVSCSKPGRRLYLSLKSLWLLTFSTSTLIISTSQGFLSGVECRKRKIGGEIFCILK